jgi:hypothetical protein
VAVRLLAAGSYRITGSLPVSAPISSVIWRVGEASICRPLALKAARFGFEVGQGPSKTRTACYSSTHLPLDHLAPAQRLFLTIFQYDAPAFNL